MTDKARLRSLVRQLAADHRDRMAYMSREICRQIETNQLWRQATTVMAFWPIVSSEPDIRPLLRSAIGCKTLLLPKTGDNRTMTLHPYDGDDSLVPGAYGIMEPATPQWTDLGVIDLALVPAVAIGHYGGHRLGHGGGYYDRFFAQPAAASIPRLGIVFPYQIMETVPYSPHDITVSLLP